MDTPQPGEADLKGRTLRRLLALVKQARPETLTADEVRELAEMAIERKEADDRFAAQREREIRERAYLIWEETKADAGTCWKQAEEAWERENGS